MKQKTLLHFWLLLLACVVGSGTMWAQAPVNTVLWQETWTGGSANQTPSVYQFGGTTVYGDATLTYAQSSDNTKLYAEALAQGTSPELLLSKSNQTWTISGIPTGQAVEMSLTFKSNKSTFAITSSTEDISIDGSGTSWTISNEGAANFDLTIKNTGSGNARIDDIVLKVTEAGSGSDPGDTRTKVYMSIDPDIINNNLGLAYKYGYTAGSLKAIVQDKDGNDLVGVIMPEEIKWGAGEGSTGDAYYEMQEVFPEDILTGETQSIHLGSTSGNNIFRVYFEGNEYYQAASATYNLEVINVPYHVVSWSINGTIDTDAFEDVAEGAAITMHANPEAVDGKVFAGWTTQAITGVTDEAPEFVTEATMGESDVTFYAVFATSTGGSAAVTDELNRAFTGVTSTSYSDWSNKTGTSGAVYAGNSAGGNESIQLRSNNSNSGVVTTTSGGKLAKVAVEWNSSTDNARILNVYGSKKAYSSASDLYGNSTQGTLLGTLAKSDGDKSLIIEGDYDYVGVRSSSGALYLASLSITWGGGATLSGYCTTVAADLRQNPELSFSKTSVNAAIGGEFEAPTLNTAEGFNGTVEFESSDESVAQVMDSETGELRLLKGGTTTITATFAGNDDFKPGVASYTLTVTDDRIATTTFVEDIELDLTEVETLTQLTPVVKDAEDNIVDCTYEDFPPKVSYEIVSDDNYIIGSIDNNSGEITLNEAVGTATLKASYNAYNVSNTYKPSECTFTITVIDTHAPGAVNNPYSVAEAIDAIDNGGDVTGVYAQGIVSEIVTEYSSTYHNISYNISADGTTDGAQLQAFRGKSYNGENFTSADDIQVGDEVVIYGDLKKYNSTYEFDKDNQLVARRITPALAFEEESYEVAIKGDLTITATSSDSDGAITYSSNDTDVAEIDPETGVVTAKAMGSVTITATIAETNTYRSFSTDVLLIVTDGRTPVNITEVTAQQTTIVADGESTFAVVTNDQENWTAAYTFTSDNEDVALVDETTGEILGITKGTANITATLNVDPEDENYIEGNVNSMSFVITVVNPSHTAHFSFNGTVDNNNDVLVEEGEAIAFPSIEEIPDGYLLVGWAAEAVEGFVFDAPETITNAVMGNKDVTYYAVLAAGKMSKTTDKLDNAFTGVSGNSYSDWKDKSVADGSGAVYAGNSAGSNVYIQLRSSNNNSGIVSTTSGGRISKVTVSWNDGTAVGRKLDIYGSNEPYEAVTDVYDIEARGDLLGSIVCGTSTELTIAGDYAYVGVRSYNGAMYLDEIDFTWENPEYDGYCSVTPKKVTLDETEGYTGTQDYAIVKLNRTVKADTWSSFTVPFNIPAAQIPDIITIKKLESSSLNGEYVTLNFTSAESIEAGVPYMVKSPVEISNIKAYGVDVDSKLNDIETTYAVMKGNMAQMNVPEDAFFISNNTWYQATSNTAHMKAFRAYIELTEFAQNAGARGFVMDIDGEVTRIDTVSQSGNAQFNGTAYDLQGRRVEKPARGLYIVNGKKVLVK